MFDYHVHSVVSFDAQAKMEECARAAAEKGLEEICFTEHYDEDYPYDDGQSGCDFELYHEEIERARQSVPQLAVKAGIEIGLMPSILGVAAAFVKSYPFDFVIASQHVIEGKDPWYGDFFTGRTVRESQRIYLEETYRNISRFDDFDVIGHIGYPDKYLKVQTVELEDPIPFTYEDFPQLIDAILLSAITRGKGIEVNTSYYPVLGNPVPHPSILRRYAQLGGEIVTMGSDAHQAKEVGQHFEEAIELLKECGLNYVCTFEGRKPVFHRL